MEIDYTKSYEQEDSLEILKLKKEHVHIFKLPPMSSSEGHVASDFTDLIFKGSMKMTLKGEFMVIYFLNADNTIFLVSIIDENVDRFIIPNKDTSRYFSIKAMNEKGIPGWYGIAFKQRNDSFDFKDTLQSFQEKLKFEKNLKSEDYKPKYDFSLMNNQTESKVPSVSQTTSNTQTTDNKKPEIKANNLSKFKFNMPGSSGK